MNERIERALERLEGKLVGLQDVYGRGPHFGTELAALIRHSSTTEDCFICGGTNSGDFTGGYRQLADVRHDEQCALLALCDAINGEGPQP